ncbi:YqgE/AlgH family protein [Bacteroides sp. 51]|uniref:YqgE/AlgH family protein n=1 Tax=Bacteroides sp. 51 TaxID=2302938 RepID=UPI0013D25DC1|nr:YqgE/AlgH family protein [Bacteroides sp. 51]NDV82879.1 YqgE/AlgH family protein [Bacteroides sp. 51]
MKFNTNIFKIESNNVLPSRGKILISEPFLNDDTFGRSVVLLVDHTAGGSMGLIMNKMLPLTLNQIIKEFRSIEEEILVYKGGPLSSDTLFFIHTLSEIPGALTISKGLYLNGNFDAIKDYVTEGNPIRGHIRFFLGYSGWEEDQLAREIKENTWLVGKGEILDLMNEKVNSLWKKSLGKLGSKYETWSRFPQIPSLN